MARATAGCRLVAQLSDPHILDAGARTASTSGIDTEAFLRRAVAVLLTLDPAPDLVLCSGDLTNDGTPSQYDNLARILAPLPMPVRLLCGNHDRRAALRAAFTTHHYLSSAPVGPADTDGPCAYVVEDLAPLRLVVLDSVIPGSDAGGLDGEQLAWLDSQLGAQPTRPTMVVLHHPPFATGIAFMDAMALQPASIDALASVLRRHRHVERVICGHLHRAVTVAFAGTVAMSAPSTAHAIALHLNRAGSGAWTLEPPAMLLHLWSPATGLVTHHRSLVAFEDRPFDEAGLG
ncbi:MAG: phosphodiesterase [Acidimicrobiales bacterium]